MEKSVKRSLMALLIVGNIEGLYAQNENVASVSKTEKKMTVGIGATYGSGIKGGMLKLDLLKNEKMSFGLRTHIGSIRWEDGAYVANPSIADDISFTSKTHPGLLVNIFATATCNLLGMNTASKARFYGTAGVGYQSFAMSSTVKYSDPQYDNEHEYSFHSLGALLCLGTDMRLGPGKIFMDVPIMIEFYEKENSRRTYKTGQVDANSTKGSTLEASFLVLNLGYALVF